MRKKAAVMRLVKMLWRAGRSQPRLYRSTRARLLVLFRMCLWCAGNPQHSPHRRPSKHSRKPSKWRLAVGFFTGISL